MFLDHSSLPRLLEFRIVTTRIGDLIGIETALAVNMYLFALITLVRVIILMGADIFAIYFSHLTRYRRGLRKRDHNLVRLLGLFGNLHRSRWGRFHFRSNGHWFLLRRFFWLVYTRLIRREFMPGWCILDWYGGRWCGENWRIIFRLRRRERGSRWLYRHSGDTKNKHRQGRYQNPLGGRVCNCCARHINRSIIPSPTRDPIRVSVHTITLHRHAYSLLPHRTPLYSRAHPQIPEDPENYPSRPDTIA